MDEKDYISCRVEDQIKWYDEKSCWYKKCHNFITIFSILISTSGSTITILGYVFTDLKTAFSIFGAISGFSVAFMLSLDKLKDFHEHFLTYRTTCEKLKQEKYLFLTKSSEYYNNNQAFHLFVERCESIMATENQTWAQLNEKKKD
ncbi:DUF4231 domain-containing protein [Thomasclavelia spiroformis]|uniref:DUF4231 domain-containing protein n=1 Tax=Thomasclavelia spiroformis TaxID=29348 RepID=UPI00241E3872|nr:DUF4231 domain-containing protein [Thomasclavelia spiroformis]MBS6685222.1 DUF4231 domain-containing protein [Thomasclavelia spiroformis]